jgi:superfamily I DNA/RNA helicase
MPESVEDQLKAAVDAVINSTAIKKIIVAGPGAGKTWLFRKLLENCAGNSDERLILTFINSLKNDLAKDLGDLAQVYTFHGYCRRLLHQKASLRVGLTEDFHYFPSLASLIKEDWELARDRKAPHFVAMMREVTDGEELSFYISRADYYDAVSFDDSVFRVLKRFQEYPQSIEHYRLLLVDEYQDFNRLESSLIDCLAKENPTVIAGDDDQALYSQLKNSRPEFIRTLYRGNEYKSFSLPFCMRCTQPIVEAVSNIIFAARSVDKLEGRIDKPYLFYPPKKGEDSKKYPRIKIVATSVQSLRNNYFGRYIEQEIKAIPAEEVAEAENGPFPSVLVIGPFQYLKQVKVHLNEAGYVCEVSESDEPEFNRKDGVAMLWKNPDDNLGWRIILSVDRPEFLGEVVKRSVIDRMPPYELLPAEYRDKVIAESEFPTLVDKEEEGKSASEEVPALRIRLTSYEGSKGLSAQHVFIIGLHEGDLPRQRSNIADLEICKFLVALTRTRKQCHLLHTFRWGSSQKEVSIFLSWIRARWTEVVKINKAYWAN